MKGIRIAAARGLDGLELVDLPDPGAPGPGEIRVRVRGSSLNFHDYAVCAFGNPKFDGLIPLADGAGTVEAVGEGVDEFASGDAVVSTFFPTWLDGPPTIPDFSTTPGDGVDGYAREVVVRSAAAFTHAPRGWSPVQSATLTTAGVTAWRALVVDGGLQAGDSVLVLGTGGVSIFALQIAKAMGATVIATSSSDAKLQRARALGADHTLNYKATPEWGEAVLALTGGRGVDHVIEVGGAGTLPQSIAATRLGGHIAMIGVLTGRSGEVPTGFLMARQARLQGLIVGSRKHQADFVSWLDEFGLQPVVDRVFPLAQLGDAFRYEESGAHFGKIGVDFEA